MAWFTVRDFHSADLADPVSTQLGGEVSEIGVASHENHNIGPHLDGKLERGSPYHRRPNGSASEIKLTPRLSLRGRIS
jgi:hypothetical protein